MLHSRLLFSATVDVPPGINRAYHPRSDGRGIYEDARQKAWKESAYLALRDWQPLPEGDWALDVSYTLYCDMRRDIDGVIKALLDVLCDKLGVDDKHVHSLAGTKWKAPRVDQCVTVTVDAELGHDWDGS